MGLLKHAERLEGVDEGLVGVLKLAISKLPFDCTVSQGLRSKAEAIRNYRRGRTKQELMAVNIHDEPLPGPKITWTLKSKHVVGMAADVYPLLPSGKLASADKPGLAMFDQLYYAVMSAAMKLNVKVRYGGDWDQDGRLREPGETDSPHFERV